MHIVSWNVASWPTALNFITERHTSLDNFLAKHRIDILALQEVKMQTGAIEKAQIPRPFATTGGTMPLNATGYESFWAPARAQNAGSKSTSKGFNGVATFVRNGWTVRAERDPLQDAALDAEGRCVLTFHGSFAIFNCYIPFAGVSNDRLPFKMKYLRALRRRMQAVRAEGYSVLLVGDLNIQRRLVDCHPDARRVDVRRVLHDANNATAAANDEEGAEYHAAAKELREYWPAVVSLLKSRVAEPVTIRATHGPVDRWRVFGIHPVNGARVQLGSPFQSEAAATGESGSAFRIDAAYVLDAATGERFESRPAESMRADELSECLSKVGLPWSASRLACVVARAGRPGGAVACRDWLNALIEEDGMVDSFSELESLARGRYTCWSQYLNERYSNCGSRIDYCLCDRGFFDAHIVQPNPSTLYNPGTSRDLNTDSEEAAAAAATAGGVWQQAGFDGSGIPEGSQSDFETQFREPHTGIIYTPPLFSDHVAVSLLLSDASLPKPLLDGKPCADSLSMQAMPYKRQRRIQDMFAAAARSKAAAVVVAAAPACASASTSAERPVTTAAMPPATLGAATSKKRRHNKQTHRSVIPAPAVATKAKHPPAKKQKPGQRGITSFFSAKQ